MLREESEISAWHGLMWLRRMILLIMVGYLKCSPYTDSPCGFAEVMEKLANSWNTRIVAQTTQGKEISPTIRFKKGLPQSDALCPMLFILCLNPIAWKVRATERNRLSKPISSKITHLLYQGPRRPFKGGKAKNSGQYKEIFRSVFRDLSCICGPSYLPPQQI